MAFCQNCGAKLADGTKFCTNCGTPVAVFTPAASTVTQPVYQQVSAPAQPAVTPTPEPVQSAYTAAETAAYTMPEIQTYTMPEVQNYNAPVQPEYTMPDIQSYNAPVQPDYAAQQTYAQPPFAGYTIPVQQSYAAPVAAGAPPKSKKSTVSKNNGTSKKGGKAGLIAAVAAVVVALLVGAYFLFFNGENDKGEADPNVGVYLCSSVDAAGQSFQAKELFGEDVKLEIISSDKARLYIGEEFILGKWSLSGQKFHFECSADGRDYTLDGKMVNGVITVSDAFGLDCVMTFGTAPTASGVKAGSTVVLPVETDKPQDKPEEQKSEDTAQPESGEQSAAAEAGTEPEEQPSAPAEEPKTETPASTAPEIGKFVLESYTAGGYTYGTDMLKTVGMDGNYIELRSDGSGEFKLLETVNQITWKDGVIYMSGVQFATYELDGDTFTMNMQGVIYTYKR